MFKILQVCQLCGVLCLSHECWKLWGRSIR